MEIRDWRQFKERVVDQLFRQTGQSLDERNARVRELAPPDRAGGMADGTGHHRLPRMLLGNEHFGYPDFLAASADDLIDGQYASRPHPRPILEALILQAAELGEVTVQARKSYVSLVGPRRTFAMVQATTRQRVDLGLRLPGPPEGRVKDRAGLGSGQMTARIPLHTLEEVDEEVAGWLHRAFTENL